MTPPLRPGQPRPGQAAPAAKQGPSRPVAVAAVVVLMLALAGLYVELRPAPPPKPAPPPAEQATRFLSPTDKTWVVQKAQECGGDFSRLSPEDQQKMHAFFKGGEYMALRQIAGQPTSR